MGNISPSETPGLVSNQTPETAEKIRRLKARVNYGLIAMALFIALSIGAIRDFDFLPSFPENIHALLGHPPSASLISTALIVYIFSAIVLVLARMMSGSGVFTGFSQVGYLAGFYIFYHFAKGLEDNFWAVFASGMTILALDPYHMWIYSAEEIKKITGGTGREEEE